MDGQTLYAERERMGERLAAESPVEADVVIPVPDSGTPAAQGYARASGLPFADGLIKNRYVGRTFIQPDQALRDHGVRLKFNPLAARDRGPAARRRRRLDRARLDDPQDRRRCCATPARARCTCAISSPPIISPCFYGIDMAGKDELIAAGRSLEEIREHLGADSLAYLSLEGLQARDRAPGRPLLPRVPDRQLPGAGARGGGRQAALRARSPRARERAPERPRAADLRRRPASRCDAADAVVDRLRRGGRVDAHAARARRPRRLRGPRLGRRLSRPGARRGHRRRRHEAAAAARGRRACATRASTSSAMCVNDVLTLRRRAGAVPRLHRRRAARPRAGRGRRRGRRRRLPRRRAARCSAARPPSCPTCTAPTTSTSPASRSASPSATAHRRRARRGGRRGDRAGRRAACTPTASRSCAACSSAPAPPR